MDSLILGKSGSKKLQIEQVGGFLRVTQKDFQRIKSKQSKKQKHSNNDELAMRQAHKEAIDRLSIVQ